MTDDRYERVTFRGHTVDRYTMQALLEMERRLGYELTILQGSYNKGVGASAGTHDGGGAVDLAPFEADRKVHVGREVGFDAWHRTAIPNLWGEHVHMILHHNEKASAAAKEQMQQYADHTNGLKDHAHDPFPFHPDPPIVFQYKQGGVAGDGVKPLPVRGIDMSHHNAGPVRWSLMRGAGVRFAYHKVTEGSTVVDPAYRSRRAELVAFNKSLPVLGRLLGRTIRPGGYHFASPDGGDAAAEARWFMSHLIASSGDVAPVLDLEQTGGLSPAAIDRWAVSWIKTVKAAGFSRVGLYTGFNVPDAVAAADFVWRPRYNSTNTPPVLPWDVWQFSDGNAGVPHTVPGYGGNLDLNTLRKGFRVRKMRLRKAGVTPAPEPAPEPVPQPEPTPEPEPTPAPTPRAAPLAVISWNVGDGHDSTKVTDLIELSTHAHLIGLQEASDRADAVETFTKAHPMWDAFNGTKTGAPAVPILYRVDQFGLIEAKAHLCVPARNVGAVGAGPTVSKAKFCTELHLVHAQTGQHVHHLNTHMLPSVTRTDLPAAEKKKRREHFRDHVAALVKIINAIPDDHVVILTMDGNAPASFQLWKPLKDIGMVGWQLATTHGRSKIDHALYRKSSRVTPSKAATYSTSSDHKAAGVVLRIAGKTA